MSSQASSAMYRLRGDDQGDRVADVADVGNSQGRRDHEGFPEHGVLGLADQPVEIGPGEDGDHSRQIAAAAAVSIALIRALANSLRRKAPCSIPGKATSST